MPGYTAICLSSVSILVLKALFLQAPAVNPLTYSIYIPLDYLLKLLYFFLQLSKSDSLIFKTPKFPFYVVKYILHVNTNNKQFIEIVE